MSVSVADELTFDELLESLSIERRASVMRVLKSRGYESGVTERDVSEAYSRGYYNGQSSAISDKKVTREPAD